MSPSRRTRIGAIALAALAVTTVAGCGGSPGVDMQNIGTSLVFGVHTPGPQAQAAEVQPVAEQPGQAQFPEQAILPDLGATGFPSIPGFVAPQAACPTAPIGAAPAKIAGTDVEGMPQAGAYRWKQSGTDTVSVLGINVTIPVGGFHERYVRRVTQVPSNATTDPLTQLPGSTAAPDSIFTYQTVIAYPGVQEYVVDTWQVKTNPSPADPEGGLALLAEDLQSLDGKTTAPVFSFKPGLLFLPLPVLQGVTTLVNPTSWNSTAVDAVRGVTYKLAGQIQGRDNVDACGEFVEGWKVNAALTVTNPSNTAGGSTQVTQNETYDVAPQLGCILIYDKVDRDVIPRNHFKAELSTGQLHPDPLPEELK